MRMARLILIGLGLNIVISGVSFAQADSIFLDRRVFYKQGIVGVYDIEGNFNPGRYKWEILTPSQSPIPELRNYVDPNAIQPFRGLPAHSERRDVSNLIYKNCDDSDRCEFFIPQTESTSERGLIVRLAGVHAPHHDASCEQEALLGKQAKDLLHEYLSSAVHIELRNVSRWGKEMSGRLVVDGQDLSELLVDQGLADPLRGKKKDWCS